MKRFKFDIGSGLSLEYDRTLAQIKKEQKKRIV
jgi:hypothetical protein